MAFRNKAVLWEEVPALRVLIPLVLGIVLYDQGRPAFPANWSVVILCTIALLAVYAGLYFLKKRPWFPVLIVQLLLVAMGVLLCYAGDDSRQPQWMGEKADSSRQLMAIVRQQPLQKQYTMKMEVSAVLLLGPEGPEAATGHALVYLYKTEDTPELNKGDTILLPHKWEPIQNTGSPFGLDYPRYCRRKNIHLQQFTDRIVLWGRQDPTLLSIPERLRQRSLATIQQYIPDHTAAALMEAMLMGDERHIDPDMRQTYSDTGIIHIVSISGAHIAILFFAISFAFRRLGLRKHAWIQYAGSIVLIWFYITIAGMPVPAIRAATMFTLLSLGHMIGRQHNPLNQLFATAVLMLLLQPMWLFSIGFQLSFVAVLSLILFYKPLLALWPVQNKILAFLAQSLAASLAAEVLVAPLVAYYFHSFPLMFLATNLVAGLAMSFILCLGLLLLLLAKLSFVAQALAAIIVFLSRIVHQMIQLADRVDVSFFKTLFISPLLLLALYLLVFCVCMLRKSRAAVWATLGCLLLISSLTFVRSLQVNRQKRLMVFLEKGKTHAELLQGTDHHLMNGAGPPSYGISMARIGFGANNAGADLLQHVLLVNGRRMVWADSSSMPERPFPADVLLVVSGVAAPDTLLKYCTPGLVVCAAGSRAESRKWEKLCAERKLAFHSIRTRGPFIFP